MIHILAIREFYSESQKRNIKAEVWFDRGLRAPSVESIFLDPLSFLQGKVDESERVNIYYTVCECLEQKGRKLTSQHHIPFDIDKLDLPDGAADPELLKRTAEVACEALGIRYSETGVLFSGNGLQLLVGIQAPITDVGYFDQARAHYKALCDKITLRLMQSGLKGQADVAVWSPARLMRYPETWNEKPDKPKRRAYVLNKEIQRVDFALESASGLPTLQAGDHLNPGTVASLITPDVKAIMDGNKGCKFLNWVQVSPNEVTEPQWYAALSITARFPEGQAFSHHMSSGHKGYSYEETQQKIEQALERGGPRTCKNINSISDKCQTCVHFNTDLSSPIMIEGPDHISTQRSGFYFLTYDKNGNVKKSKPDYEGLWKFFKRKYNYISIIDTDAMYVWEDNFWKAIGRDMVEAFAQEHFDPKPNNNQRKEFSAWVKINNLRTAEFFAETTDGKMNFQNGVFEVRAGILHPHSSVYGFRSILPCNYTPGAPAPKFRKFMETLTMKRQSLEHVLQEFMGYTFGNMDCRYEKALLLSGDGANGKSTFVRLIRALAGKDSASNLSIKAMNFDQNRALMEGKIVNIAEENSRDSFKDTELLKNLVSGGVVQIKEVYKRPHEFENRTKIILLCNVLPRNFDQTHGFYRKLLIVPCDAVFSEDLGNIDYDIYNKLVEELPGIFNFIMEGYHRLYNQGKFTNSLEVTEAINKYSTDSNPMQQWFNDVVQLTDNLEDIKYTSELHGSYAQFCKLGEFKFVEDSAQFARLLSKMLEKSGRTFEHFKNTKKEDRRRGVKGVKIIEFGVGV